MIASKNTREKRLAQLIQAVPTRGLERHPMVLKGISELPSELQSPTLQEITGSQNIKEIISFPQQIQRGHHYVPKQALLFTHADVIHVMASIWPDQEPEITYLRGNGLMFMQITLILLYGFLEIVAQGNTSPTKIGMEFNTVAWDQISRPLRRLLQADKDTPVASAKITSYSPSAQQAVGKLPLKFSNGVRIYGVLPGEQLGEVVFQSSTWERWLLFFQRAILANTLILLTSNYVVVIRAELAVSQGWILTYIPRKSIVGITNQACSKWNELLVQLKRGDQEKDYRILLTGEAAQAWRKCWIDCGGAWHELEAR